MIEAYVLIQTGYRRPPQVAKDLKRIPGVTRADVTAGLHDVVVRVAAVDVDSLEELIGARIQATDGVVRTLTCPVVPGPSAAARHEIAPGQPSALDV